MKVFIILLIIAVFAIQFASIMVYLTEKHPTKKGILCRLVPLYPFYSAIKYFKNLDWE